jgi:sugar (pentulose or hexulose) kinase
MPTSWLTYNLTGIHKLVINDVFTLIDGKTRKYSEEIFRIIDIEDYRHLFPEPIDAWEIVGELSPSAADATGLPSGIPVVNMGWDTICCTAGVGAINDGQANMILGTSGVIQLVMPYAADTPPRLGCVAAHVVPGKWCQLIAPMTGTPNSDWFVNNFTHEDKERARKEGRGVYALFDEEIAKVPAGSNGVIFHPYMSPAGENSPFTNSAARGNFFGLLPSVTRPVMLRAIYEGMAFSFRHCLDAYSFPVSEIRLSGGGSKSSVWCQIFSDICGTPITLISGTEYGAKGAAWNAAWAAGAFKTQQDACDAFCKVDRVYKPNPALVRQYSDLYEIYKIIPRALFEAWDKRIAFLKKYDCEG